MKVSKITASICILLDLLLGVFIVNVPETYTLVLNILLGVFTWLFVSIVTSLFCYLHEKVTLQKILCIIKQYNTEKVQQNELSSTVDQRERMRKHAISVSSNCSNVRI